MNTFLDKTFKKKLTLEDNIFYHNEANKESKEIEKFYNISPFPNYSQDNSKRDTLLRGEKNLFFKNLKNFIGYNKKVIEVGSGTCQLSMYLALETNNEIENAKSKLHRKNLDMIVLNSLQDKGAGFATNTNKITIIDKDLNIKPFDLKSKAEVAQDIIKEIIIKLF